MKRKLLFLSMLCFYAGSIFSQNDDLVLLNQSVPDFRYIASDGDSVSVKSHRSKVVLINFFASWCGPCRAELPIINKRIWEKYRNNPNFVLLCFGREHNLLEVQQFQKQSSLTIPLLPDPNRKIYSLFATQLIPRTYLIDQNGKVVYILKGFEETDFQKMLTKLDGLLR